MSKVIVILKQIDDYYLTQLGFLYQYGTETIGADPVGDFKLILIVWTNEVTARIIHTIVARLVTSFLVVEE